MCALYGDNGNGDGGATLYLCGLICVSSIASGHHGYAVRSLLCVSAYHIISGTGTGTGIITILYVRTLMFRRVEHVSHNLHDSHVSPFLVFSSLCLLSTLQ